MFILQTGKISKDSFVAENFKQHKEFCRDVSIALYCHVTGMWETADMERNHISAKSNKDVTATFPTALGKILINTSADRTHTTISMVQS